MQACPYNIEQVLHEAEHQLGYSDFQPIIITDAFSNGAPLASTGGTGGTTAAHYAVVLASGTMPGYPVVVWDTACVASAVIPFRVPQQYNSERDELAVEYDISAGDANFALKCELAVLNGGHRATNQVSAGVGHLTINPSNNNSANQALITPATVALAMVTPDNTTPAPTAGDGIRDKVLVRFTGKGLRPGQLCMLVLTPGAHATAAVTLYGAALRFNRHVNFRDMTER